MKDAGIEPVKFGQRKPGRAMRDGSEIEILGDRRQRGIGRDWQAGAGQRRLDGNGQRFVALQPEIGTEIEPSRLLRPCPCSSVNRLWCAKIGGGASSAANSSICTPVFDT